MPDIALIDIGLGGIDGVQVLKIMRSHPATMKISAILMTGLPIPPGALQAISENLGAGPIHVKGDLQDLVGRINESLTGTVLPALASTTHVLRRGPLELDLARRKVLVGGHVVPNVTAKLFDVLLALFEHPGPVSQAELLSAVWAGQGDLKAVQMAVGRLRADLKLFPSVQIKTSGRAYELLVLPAVPSSR